MNYKKRLLTIGWLGIFILVISCSPSSVAVPNKEIEESQPLYASEEMNSLGSENPTGYSISTQSFPIVADVVELTRPSVVSIATERSTRSFFSPSQSIGTGTGVIIRRDGHIVTNYHVVEDARRIRVTTDDGRAFEAKITGEDPMSDLAILKITDQEPFPSLPFAESGSIRVGDWVIAIGNALGLPGGPTVTVGVVGALNRTLTTYSAVGIPIQFRDMVQTDAAINSGNSGGPLVNLKGEIVGINTIVYQGAQGIGFSIGTFTVAPVVRSILEHGRVVWPWIGISPSEISSSIALEMNLSNQDGILILKVWPGSPAEKAGLSEQDVILSIDGFKVRNLRDLQAYLRDNLAPRDTATIEYIREDSIEELQVVLEEMPRTLDQ